LFEVLRTSKIYI